MNEEFIYYLWKYTLVNHNLTITSGEQIEIISPGIRNLDSGPDFFNAMIKIGETRWAGNVEIHVNSSDWYKHMHQNNPSYDNIILHVVFNDNTPVHRKNSEIIPTLELKNKFNPSILRNYQIFLKSRSSILCHNQIHYINHFDKLGWLDSLMAERLEQKSEEISRLLDLSKNNLLQIFYQRLARSFGYSVNADAMEQLASSLPLNMVTKHINNLFQIESLLYGQSGLLPSEKSDDYISELKKEWDFLRIKYKLVPMDNSLWKFMRMRPVSFPTIRISQFANLIYKSSGLLNDILEADKLQYVISLLSVKASPYWDNHFQFEKKSKSKSKKLGSSSINTILINTIIPIIFVYGRMKNDVALQEKALEWSSQIKPEWNTITREFKSMGIVAENAMQSQALIQLKNNYCLKKRCLSCRFGHLLLNRV